MTDRVLLQFANSEQAKVFFNWFKQYGYNQLLESDSVNDNLPYDLFYNCISVEEEPGSLSDPSSYYIEIE